MLVSVCSTKSDRKVGQKQLQYQLLEQYVHQRLGYEKNDATGCNRRPATQPRSPLFPHASDGSLHLPKLEQNDWDRPSGGHPPGLHDALHLIHSTIRFSNDLAWNELLQRESGGWPDTIPR